MATKHTLLELLRALVTDADADTWTEEDSSHVVVTRENIERARAAWTDHPEHCTVQAPHRPGPHSCTPAPNKDPDTLKAAAAVLTRHGLHPAAAECEQLAWRLERAAIARARGDK